MVIGPHDPAMLEVFKMVKGRFIIYHGKNGLQKEYSFIAVFDLVHAIKEVVDHPHSGQHEDYFCANIVSIYFAEIIEAIKQQCNIKFLITLRLPLWLLTAFAFGAKAITKLLPLSIPITPDKVAEIKQPSWLCSSAKFNQVFNFHCRYNLEQIVKVTYQDYKKRNWI
jgi:nucleoside-diphosphate-sugar epimerase